MKNLVNKKDLCKWLFKRIENNPVFFLNKRKTKFWKEKNSPLIKNVLNIYFIINF